MIPFWIVAAIVLIELAIGALLYVLQRPNRTARTPRYRVTLKSASGVVTRLTLNGEQYERLQSFLGNADGWFEIGDERAKVMLERRTIAAVEVRVK